MPRTPQQLTLATYLQDEFPICIKLAGGHNYHQHHWHSHDFFEFVFVSHGSGTHYIGEHIYPMLQGDFYLMNMQDVHSYVCEDNLGIFNILMGEKITEHPVMHDVVRLPGLRECFLQLERGDVHKIHLAPRHERLVRTLCQRMYDEQEQQDLAWKSAMLNALSELLLCISRAWAMYGANDALEHLAPGPVAKAIAIIYKEYENDLRVSDLADRVHLSSNYFGELFKNTTGLSVQNYINKHRIDRARMFLEDGTKNMTEIAQAVGYEDPNYFARMFKRMCGVTPRDYRKRAELQRV